jgi:anti-anti-sigma factor
VFTSGLYGEQGAQYAARVSLLDISVEAGESGPVVRLSGEADLSVAGQLSDALNAQVSSGARHLTVDLSGLRFADSAAIRTLIEAHLALKRQGGTLELAGIRPEVARTLSLLGVDQVIPVRPQADPGPAEAGTGGS